MKPAALGAEDAAWLHMEDADNPMVVNVLIELAGTIEPDAVHRLMDRLTADSRFRSIVTESPLHLGRPSWKPHAGFDLDRHIKHVRLGNVSDEALRSFVGRVVSKCLPLDRPLFRLYVMEREGKGTTLLFRCHHAIADGFGLLGLLLTSALGEIDVPRPSRQTHAKAANGYLSSLVRLVTLPSDPPTSLKAPLGEHKRVAWSRPLLLAALRRMGAPASATINDVIVALIAGALRRHLLDREDVDCLTVRAMVPVNLRPPNAKLELGNRFGLVVLPLPIGIVDPIARIAAVRDAMLRLKGSREPVVSRAVLALMGRAPSFVEDVGVSFFSKKASLVLSNVPGPRRKFRLGGVPVERVIFWVPQSGKMGLGISVFSYAGTVTVGVIADSHALPYPTLLVKDLEDEVESIERELASTIVAPSELLQSNVSSDDVRSHR